MSRAVWTASALADLLRHVAWIEGHDPAAARRVRDEMDRRAEWLVDLPRVGARSGRRNRSFRVLGTPYTIVYQPFRGTVLILRVVHTRQNWR